MLLFRKCTRALPSQYAPLVQFQYLRSWRYYSGANSINHPQLPSDDTNTALDRGTDVSGETNPSSGTAGACGQKMAPVNDQFIVLDPQETGLLPKRGETGRSWRKDREHSSRGRFDIRDVTSHKPAKRQDREKVTARDLLDALERNGEKMLREEKRSASDEETVGAIDNMRPDQASLQMSPERFEQLRKALAKSFSYTQLKLYASKRYGLKKTNETKKAFVTKVMQECWKCKVDKAISKKDDLIIKRTIDLSQKDMYLLLMTDDGRILQNLARTGASIAAAFTENKLIIRASKSLATYIEASIASILNSIQSSRMSLHEFAKDHTAVHDPRNSQYSPEQLLTMVCRECSVHQEKYPEADGLVALSALSQEKLAAARQLLLWALDYKPEVTTDTIFCGVENDQITYAKYPVSDPEWFNWLARKTQWFRLQRVEHRLSPDTTSSATPPSPAVPEHAIDKVYDYCMSQHAGNVAEIHNHATKASVLRVSLGQVLTDESGRRQMFQPQAPYMNPKLLQLPLYYPVESPHDYYSVDQHDYFLQLRYAPVLSATGFQHNLPPLELWFTLGEHNRVERHTVRCINRLAERSVMLQLPSSPVDCRVTLERVSEMVPPNDEASHEWLLTHQPALQQYLERIVPALDRQLRGRTLNVGLPDPLQLDVALAGSPPAPVPYRFVSMAHHRVLSLRYMDKYRVQLSTVTGGPAGGKHSELDVIPDAVPDRTAFAQLIADVSKLL
ncbi:AaceriAGL167Cp [[Ashbya] aceris (nom. inval.)]|nr:AaceriAGL167Cp [[Ashbya] aceris (nom. inval.)]